MTSCATGIFPTQLGQRCCAISYGITTPPSPTTAPKKKVSPTPPTIKINWQCHWQKGGGTCRFSKLFSCSVGGGDEVNCFFFTAVGGVAKVSEPDFYFRRRQFFFALFQGWKNFCSGFGWGSGSPQKCWTRGKKQDHQH